MLWRILLPSAAAAVSAIGAVAMGLSPLTGAAFVVLIGGAVAILQRYRADGSPFSGSVAIVVPGMILFLVAGSLPRPLPLFGVNPGELQWVMYVAGFAALVGGILVSSRLPVRSAGLTPPVRSRSIPPADWREWLLYIGVLGALLLAVLNFATGDIPLLASDVDNARFAGDYGVAGRLWPLIHPTLQAAIIIGGSRCLQGRWDRIWIALAILSAVALTLSGGRSLFLLPLVALGLMVLDVKRPPLWILGAGGFVVAAAFTLVGYVRSLSQDADAAEFRDDRGLGAWWGTVDISLQAGPRVFASALDALQGSLLHGQILFGDIANFIVSSATRSDRAVTELLGRDVNEVGGLPPTVWGGLALDFGFIGIVIGGLVVGLILGLSRYRFIATKSLGSGLWSSYWAAYVLVSAYSYVSFRPSWIVVLGIALLAWKGFADGTTEDSDGLEVPSVSGRSRESH